MFKTLLCISLFLLQVNTVYAEIYKWVDENGKTIYGDKPTSNNADEIKIKKPPKKDKSYQERYKKQQKLLSIMEEERNEKAALKKENQEKKEIQDKKCAEMIAELQGMKNASFLYEDTDDPNNPKIFSDEQRKTEEEKYTNYIKENCR